jgi:glycolate oxidase FAD binding subunit
MTEIASALRDILAADQVVEREQFSDSLAHSLRGAIVEDALPAAVVYPDTEAQLAEVVTAAHRHHWRLLACGSSSKLGWGGLAKGIDLVISTQRLNQIVDHAVGDMTLTAAAGLKLADLNPVLAQHQQFLAVDPAYADQATLGGIVATADTGALRQRFGGVRDMLIGISFVRHDGQMAKAGGRVVKNVAGYDLMKLMTGAYGTLGIISQLTFRLYPGQEASQTVLVTGSAADTQALAADLRQSTLTPVSVDILTPELVRQLGYKDDYLLAVRFQSILPGVEEQVSKLLSMAPAAADAQVIKDSGEAEIWQQISALLYGYACGTVGAVPAAANRVVAKFGLRPADSVEMLEKLTVLLPQPFLARVHSASGIGTLRLEGENISPEILQSCRVLCEKAGGYLTILEAPKALKQSLDVWGYSGAAFGLMKGIKHQFDPQNCFSPGRYIGRL